MVNLKRLVYIIQFHTNPTFIKMKRKDIAAGSQLKQKSPKLDEHEILKLAVLHTETFEDYANKLFEKIRLCETRITRSDLLRAIIDGDPNFYIIWLHENERKFVEEQGRYLNYNGFETVCLALTKYSQEYRSRWYLSIFDMSEMFPCTHGDHFHREVFATLCNNPKLAGYGYIKMALDYYCSGNEYYATDCLDWQYQILIILNFVGGK